MQSSAIWKTNSVLTKTNQMEATKTLIFSEFKSGRYSQNGEEGILKECIKRMGLKTGTIAEFGAHNGIYCSNSRKLIEDGWKGILIEPDGSLFDGLQENNKYFDSKVFHGYVKPSNINLLIPTCDILSIDTDGSNDYDCFRVYDGDPKIVIVEINSSYPSMVDKVDEGANYSAMVKLGLERGYFLLCHTGNLIFVKNEYRELFPEAVGDGLENYEDYFDSSWI